MAEKKPLPNPPTNAASEGIPIANRSLAQSYAALPARTRLALSLGICGVAVVGILVSDLLEKKVPPTKTSETRLQ